MILTSDVFVFSSRLTFMALQGPSIQSYLVNIWLSLMKVGNGDSLETLPGKTIHFLYVGLETGSLELQTMLQIFYFLRIFYLLKIFLQTSLSKALVGSLWLTVMAGLDGILKREKNSGRHNLIQNILILILVIIMREIRSLLDVCRFRFTATHSLTLILFNVAIIITVVFGAGCTLKWCYSGIGIVMS